MDKTQISLIKILSAGIRGKKVNVSDYNHIELTELIKEAKNHSVTSLVYNSGDWEKIIKYEEKEIFNQWKKEVFIKNVRQIKHIQEISMVLDKFNQKNISVIVLKGLVLREFYPKAELRTMGDADILVKEENYEKVKEVLQQLKYVESYSSDKHIVFKHEKNKDIEVHWDISNKNYFKESKEFEKTIWDNAIEVDVGHSKVLSLGREDLLFHLFLHMIDHLKSSGFGLRQLCDVVVFIESEKKFINWISFHNKIKNYKIEKFCYSILKVCNDLFNLNVPININWDSVDKNSIDLIIKSMFSSGTYGRKSTQGFLGHMISYYQDGNVSKESNRLKQVIPIVFPNKKKIPEKYSYAKKYSILMPIAWIHRLTYKLFFDKRHSLKEKISIIDDNTLEKSKERNDLIKLLNL